MKWSPKFLSLLLCLAACHTATAGLLIHEDPRWEPIVDTVYLQAFSKRIEFDQPLKAVAIYEDHVYAGGPSGLYRVGDTVLEAVEGFSGPVDELQMANGKLWVLGDGTLHRFDGTTWATIALDNVVDLCADGKAVIVATDAALYRMAGTTPARLTEDTRAWPPTAAPTISTTAHGSASWKTAKSPSTTFPTGAPSNGAAPSAISSAWAAA